MRTTTLCTALLLALAAPLAGCEHQSRTAYPATDQGLKLARVVLYRNGVGYFERQGEVEGNVLWLKVRKDQVNDLLKSLTIVDRKSGKAVSVSMPLDPQTWANVALQTLSPGHGSLAQVLDSLRGLHVEIDTTQGNVEGRIVMVEESDEEPDPSMPRSRGAAPTDTLGHDYKVTLMQEEQLKVVRLSKVRAVTLKDGDLAMQFHRRLDAAAGEGMFQQVNVAIRLSGDEHDLVVSYVVEAPMWKPTYRVVLPKDGKGKALLQAWAVVDNTSGEDWREVSLALTAGAPIAFKYDLHTPRNVFREDLSSQGTARRARVAMGETTFDEEPAPPPASAPVAAAEAPMEEEADDDMGGAKSGAFGGALGSGRSAGLRKSRPKRAPRPSRDQAAAKDKRERIAANLRTESGLIDGKARELAEKEVSLDSLRRSTLAQTRAATASGQTRFEIDTAVTVPDSSSTMVAIVNQEVEGEETFMFRPGGAGVGYDNNPYRVVRFRNSSPFVLEPGPISIYSGGSFVGEGISETVGSGTSATIPFAVEPGIMVRRESKSTPEELRLVKIVRGTIHVERFHQITSIWNVQAQTMKEGFTVLIRHPRAGTDYKLKARPKGTEDLPNAYLVPVNVAPGSLKNSVELVEQTPSQTTISIWNKKALGLLEKLVIATNVGPAERKALEPVIKLRREIGTIETQQEGLQKEMTMNDRRVRLHQRTVDKLAKDTSPEAVSMRAESSRRIKEFSKEGDRINRELTRLEQERTRKTLQLEKLLEQLTIAPKK